MKLIKELLEEIESTPKTQDLKDAFGVFNDFIFNSSQFKLNTAANIFEKFFKNGEMRKLMMSDVEIFHDFGRRISSADLNNPIIVLQLPTGKYKVLDGQHRVLTKREAGDSQIDAYVVTIPWNKGMKKRGQQTYYF